MGDLGMRQAGMAAERDGSQENKHFVKRGQVRRLRTICASPCFEIAPLDNIGKNARNESSEPPQVDRPVGQCSPGWMDG